MLPQAVGYDKGKFTKIHADPAGDLRGQNGRPARGRKKGEVMKVHYAALGLVNTRAMFAAAIRGGFAVPAYNFNNMDELQALLMGCLGGQPPGILQAPKGA